MKIDRFHSHGEFSKSKSRLSFCQKFPDQSRLTTYALLIYCFIRVQYSMTKTWRFGQLAVRVRSLPFPFLHPSFDHSLLFLVLLARRAELNTLIRVNGWPAASGRFLKSPFPRLGRVQRSAFILGLPLWALYERWGPRPRETVVSRHTKEIAHLMGVPLAHYNLIYNSGHTHAYKNTYTYTHTCMKIVYVW